MEAQVRAKINIPAQTQRVRIRVCEDALRHVVEMVMSEANFRGAQRDQKLHDVTIAQRVYQFMQTGGFSRCMNELESPLVVIE